MFQKYRYFASGAAFCVLFAAVNPASAVVQHHTKNAVPKLPSLPAPVSTGSLTVKPGGLRVSKSTQRQSLLPETLVYSGLPAEQTGITVSSWGGGVGVETPEIAYNKGNSFKITTLGYYQGARINFSKPLDLGDRSPVINRILQVLIRFAPPEDAFAFDSITHPLTAALHDNDALHDGVFRGKGTISQVQYGDDDDNGGGMNQAPQQEAAPPPPPPPAHRAEDDIWQPPFSTMRILFTFADGTQVDVVRPLAESNDDTVDRSTAWIPVSIPLSVLPAPAGTGTSPLQSITIGGDGNAQFYVGKIDLVNDTTPITCFAGDQQDVARGDVVTLQATAQGGASTLKYSWDFDASDGITEQATGQTVKTQFFKSGKDFTVTLTVSDADGVKKPAVSKTTITVEE